ncbi:MAG TPA: hypothetical protein VH054_05530, partial [Polyangiaceae bacterium]|nr:hypothetical protein [Polyangiaceae bacterium]
MSASSRSLGLVALLACAAPQSSTTTAPAATSAPPEPTTTASATASTVTVASTIASASAPPSRHDQCCASQSECGAAAVCSPYTFNVSSHCRKVCRDKCKTNADCP